MTIKYVTEHLPPNGNTQVFAEHYQGREYTRRDCLASFMNWEDAELFIKAKYEKELEKSND